MEFKIYKFNFTTGVHFGKRNVDDAEYTFGADTLFSAMCHEYLKQGMEEFTWFITKVMDGRIRLSDGFPYIGDTYYIPKPMLKIAAEKNQGDSTIKKAYKKLSYIPVSQLEAYLQGNLRVEEEADKLKKQLGTRVVKVSASIRGEKETVPYRVGTYYFHSGSGLYVIVGYEEKGDLEKIEECFAALSLVGIGGKRSSGLGRFEFYPGKNSQDFIQRLNGKDGTIWMSLSCSLPKDQELEKALEGASYLLQKRSGFVVSSKYAPEQLRKQDLYVLKSGSCFRNIFEGDVYDVSDGGAHPVYRYAKPLFMEVIF